jgi:hypothetical protein
LVDEAVLEPLVVPFTVVVSDELPDGAAQVSFAEWHHPIETLRLDRQHEPLGERV